MGDHAHRVGGAAAGGVEAVGGDLHGVPVIKIAGQGVLVQDDLGHPLAEGAGADDDADAGVPDVGGEELGCTGGILIGQHNHRGGGEGLVVAAEGPVGAVAVLQIGQQAGAGEGAHRPDGRVHHAAAVAPEIHNPPVGLIPVSLQAVGEVLHRLAAEGVAVDVADVAVPQLGVGGGDGDGRPGEADGGALAVPQVGDGDLGARLTLQQAGHGVPVLPGDIGSVHGGDQIPRLEAAGGGRRVLIYPLNQQALPGNQGGDADAHQLGVRQGAAEQGVLLRGEILGIGVAQGLQHAGDGGMLQHLLRHVVNIVDIQQISGLFRGQGPGGGGEGQRQAQEQGQQAGAALSFHRKMPPWA